MLTLAILTYSGWLVVGNTLELKPASYAELGKNKMNLEKLHGLGAVLGTISI